MQRILANVRLVFGVFVLLGFAVIVAFAQSLRNAPSGGQAHWGMVLTVVALMGGFGIIIWLRWRTGQSTDTDAEAFYYLGFIYTLITLIVTFYPLLTSQTPPSSQQVLGLFGLGLITTFVGLAGRIVFLQGAARDPIEEGHRRLGSAYLEAARQIEATTLQISRVGSELERVTRASHEAIETSIQTTAENVTHAIEGTSQNLTAMVNMAGQNAIQVLTSTVDKVATALRDVEERLVALKLPPAKLAEQLKQRLEALIASGDTASESISTLATDAKSLSGELEKTTLGLASAVLELSAMKASTHDTAKALASVHEGINLLNTGTHGLTQAFATTGLASRHLAEKTQVLMDNVSGLDQGVAMVSRTLSGFTDVASRASSPLSEVNAKLSGMSAQTAGLLETLSGIVQFAKVMQEAQKETLEQIQRSIVVLKSHQEAVEDVSRKLREGLIASDSAIRQVHESLINAAKFITTRLQ